MSNSLIKANTLMALGEYNSAIKYFKEYMDEEPHIPLSKEVLQLLLKAYNKLSNDNRYYIRELEAYLESLQGGNPERIEAITSLLDETRNDLIAICTEVVNIIDNNLIKNINEIRERVLIYNMKGVYYRYMWEINKSDAICKKATKAYHEAMSVCQWNFEPTDPYLLQVALNFTTHLNNANNTEQAISILTMVIQNTHTEDLQNYDFLKKSYVELILKYLNETLIRFQNIFNKKLIQIIELIEESENNYQEDSEEEDNNFVMNVITLDNVITRRLG